MNEYLLVWEASIKHGNSFTFARRVKADSPEQAVEDPHVPRNTEVTVYHIPIGTFMAVPAVVVSKVRVV